MLEEEVASWLQRRLTQRDKLLVILMYARKPSSIQELRAHGVNLGFRIPQRWNPSAILARSKGLAVKTTSGWQITRAGREHLDALGLSETGKAVKEVNLSLHSELDNVVDSSARAFVQEAITAFELGLYRSAVVMSWLSAVHFMYAYVREQALELFNTAAREKDPRWKDANNEDGLARMAERDFLERLHAISVIGKSTKAALVECLDRRNGCSHPNSLRLGANTAAHHIEILLLNVFTKFRIS